ncbi:NUDIX domain-containing protein [Kitasatospora sp. NPDC004799]|uniref:NUDIX domain-containing protein n=1 Tax=Kitasatospora sp. NPDC004799 TaxID=3154460 RepID=UPI0033A89288
MSRIRILTDPPARRSGHQTFALREDPDGSGSLSVLLVEPAYKDGLTLPGGSAEQDELPHHAARRHLETETGLALPLRTILTIDYVPAARFPEGLNLVYAGGMLTPQQAVTAARHQPPQEIRALRWVPRHQLRELMTDDQHRRVEDAWDAWEHGDGIPLLVQGIPVPVS